MGWAERDADRAIEEAEEYERLRTLCPQLREKITKLEGLLRSCGLSPCTKCGAWKRPICICDDCGGE